MTPAEFATYVRYKTRTNSTTFPDAEILSYMAIRQDEIAQDILKVDEDILLIPQYTSLVANQRIYPEPQDILSRMKRIEVKLDGTNWIVLTEIDITQINVPIATEDDITSSFNNYQLSKSNPSGAQFDILRKSVHIYSGTIIDVTDGLRLWCNTWPTAIGDLSSTADMSQDPSTTTHGIPRPSHEPWARGVIIDWKGSREKPIPLTEAELKYDFDKQKVIETLRHGNLDREVIAHIPPASDRGNDGSDY